MIAAFFAGMVLLASTSTDALYRSAIATMESLSEPPFATYTLHGEPRGVSFQLFDRNHAIWLGPGPDVPSVWKIKHRAADFASEITDDYGTRYVSQRPIFDASWLGAYRALRDGMFFFQPSQKTPLPTATPTAATAGSTPSAETATSLREIGIVNVIGPAIYRLEDRGAHICPNGDPGTHIHLTSRDDNPRHQLTDVIVDLKSTRFCVLVFDASKYADGHTIVEQHYAQVGDYWMQTDGFIAILVPGVPPAYGRWTYRLQDFTFPGDLPPRTFVPSPKQ